LRLDRLGQEGYRINSRNTKPATASASAAKGIRFTIGCRCRDV
jgi:hypothetical protein